MDNIISLFEYLAKSNTVNFLIMAFILFLMLKAVNKLVEAGYKVGVLIAPIILVDNWKDLYENLLKKMISSLSLRAKKEIIFEIESIIEDMDIVDEELDYISSTISERDYYQNTNK